jgi:hypothetical protein
MIRRLFKWFGLLVLIMIVAVLGLRYYFIIKPVEYPINFDANWNSGPLVHILPTVNYERILIKTSFKEPLAAPPILEINGRHRIMGTPTDTDGRFWQFDAQGLEPDTEYRLVLKDNAGQPMTDVWPLKTFPAPGSTPEKLRLLIFTGLGGHDVHIEWFKTGPLPLHIRHKLLNKALSFRPDALISSGDQIYYDLLYDKSAKVMGDSPRSKYHVGEFDRNAPILGGENESVLKRAVDPQIAYLYGVACRSVPTFFLLDDHDYFENDIAQKGDGIEIKILLLAWRSPFYKGGVSFPPDDFMLDLGRSAQKLYLPEFLPVESRPLNLPATGAPDWAPGVSECYGTLQYGKLFEGLLYESRRYTSLSGKNAVMIHPDAESWLVDRMKKEEAVHVVNLPATIFGWSAGKWMEWYPDVRDETGSLTKDLPKYKWQPGWFSQHNRLLAAASGMQHTLPLFICGDIHDQAEGWIKKSGDLDLSANPIISVASGSLGTGPRAFPSSFRGLVAEPPNDIVMDEKLPSLEKNGFVIADFTTQSVVIKFYAWRPPEPIEAIENLKPHHVINLKVLQ